MKRTGISAVLLLVALPGLNTFGNFHPVQEDAAHVQRAIQLAHTRELSGQTSEDTIRISASGLRKVNQVNEFIARYSAQSLKGRFKNHSAQVARAVIDSGIRYGFDPLLLLAVIENESRFDPTVVGTHGEIGLMQLKPDTAEWIAKKARIRWHGADSLRDPATNIRLGAAYLSMLRSKFGFDKDLYLAAYNMGVTNLIRLLADNTRPQTYPQKTLEHYSKIYVEFLGQKGRALAANAI